MPMIDVLVVDDSFVMRKLIISTLESHPSIRVVGTAEDGQQALQALDRCKPDVVILDVEMPVMDGLTALDEIRRRERRLPVLMFSSLTQRGAQTTIEALTRGASDYVGKPTQVQDLDQAFRVLQQELIPKLIALGERAQSSRAGVAMPASTWPQGVRRTAAPKNRSNTAGASGIDAVCIGVSTGGPVALVSLIEAWTRPLPVPVFVVQHMPPRFTQLLADRLSGLGCMPVQEPYDGQLAQPGQIYLAPGGWHMTLERQSQGVRLRVVDLPPQGSCKPSVDLLFRSAAEVYGPHLLGVVMTGMGHDGLMGSQCIVDAGGEVWAQDQASSVVWGMPGAIAQAGLAQAIVPLQDIATNIVRRVQA
jgi:two-component system chemotaxis response regulator CheB